MRREFSIITVGFSPAWDITCKGRNLDWGLHKYIDEQTIRPAGKALNVSKALAWMGQRNIAAGLWGRNDYQQMQAAARSLCSLITIKMTAVVGSTRQNVTVLDTAKNRDMHLRNISELVSRAALQRLKADLEALVSESSVCIFAGAMPEEEFLPDIVRMIESWHGRGAKIVLDTSGPALGEIVDTGCVWLIKPNVRELCELLTQQVQDNPAGLARAGRRLLEKVDLVLISRGRKGAVVVSTDGAWQGRCITRKETFSTVGCGDYLLAGFLKALWENCRPELALKSGLKVAAARAWGWDERKTWPQVQKQITVCVNRI